VKGELDVTLGIKIDATFGSTWGVTIYNDDHENYPHQQSQKKIPRESSLL